MKILKKKIIKNNFTQLIMDLKLIANNLNEDCLSEIYSFVNRKQLCYDFLIKKREDIIVQGVMKPKLKTFQEGRYYIDFSTNRIGHNVLFIKKITKCFITYDYYAYYLIDPNEFATEKRKRKYDDEGNEYLKERYIYNIKDFIELEKLPYCCYVLDTEFRFKTPPQWKEYNYDYEQEDIIRVWIEGKINERKEKFRWRYKCYYEFDWLLNDLRKKKIKEAEDEIVYWINRKQTSYNTHRIIEKSEYIEFLKTLLE